MSTTAECKTRRRALQQALRNRNSEQVAKSLILPPVLTVARKNVSAPHFSDELFDQSGGNDTDWSGVLKSLNMACFAANTGDVKGCYEAQASLHSSLNVIFGSSSGNWLVPALYTVCDNTHKIAVLADSKLGNNGGRANDHSRLQSAVTLIQDSFSKSLNDRKEYKPDVPLSEEGSKKAAVLYIVNHLFSMYFRLNTLRLCRNLVLPVEKRHLHEQGPMGYQVTYRYYVGRLNMYEDQYELAEENLSFAFAHCYKHAIKNKKRILNYLLPVKLLRGRFPTIRLLQKYSLHMFAPLVSGIRKGDLRTFNDALHKHQDLFIRRGTYLLLEKCKKLCYRNLFKRLHIISNKIQIPLSLIVSAFQILGMQDMELDEVECILSNLIFRGYVRGYISHTKRILVLSKKDPFPVNAVLGIR